MIKHLRDNAIPILASLTLHGLLLWILAGVRSEEPKKPVFKPPNYVKAELVQLKAQVKKTSGQQTRKNKQIEVNKKREAEKKREAARKKAALQKKKAEEQQKKALAKKREQQKKATDAKRREEQKQLAAKKRQEDTARKKAEQKKQEQRRLEFERALVAEERLLVAEQNEIEANSYSTIIRDKISQKWSRPPSARKGMTCDLEIELVPTGKVIRVDIIRSSGNTAFDRSAEQAVRAVDQFDELQGIDADIFEQYFRRMTFHFNPEDRRL